MDRIKGVRRRTWAEIDLDRAEYNYQAVRSAVQGNVKVCCVVKANAYGHGAVRLSLLYEKLGADYLAVSNIEEALQLRQNRIALPILILGYTPEECAQALAEENITQTVYSYEYGKRLAQAAAEKGVRVKIHVKLDTGMGRIGFLCRNESKNELTQAEEICQYPSLLPEGIFTHFASADENIQGDDFTESQFRSFQYGVRYLEEKGIQFKIRHCANSAAIFDHPECHMDMVRAGIVLYGLRPSPCMRRLPKLLPVMAVKSVVSHRKDVTEGETVSYGATYRVRKKMTVATVPVGYADGFLRANGNEKGKVLLNGSYAPILGRICMDQMMLDVSGIGCEIGDIVTVFGDDALCSAEKLAEMNGTINYEITCAVAMRVPRAFFKGGELQEWQDLVYTKDLDFSGK